VLAPVAVRRLSILKASRRGAGGGYQGHLMMLSTVATSSIEDVIAARSAPSGNSLSHKHLGSWPSDRQRAEAAVPRDRTRWTYRKQQPRNSIPR